LSGKKEMNIDVKLGIEDNLLAIAFSPDGRTLISSSGGENGSTVTWWSVESGARIKEQKYEGKVFGLEYDSAGVMLSLSIITADDTICVLTDGQHGDRILEVRNYCGDFSPDGRFLLQQKENIVFIWDMNRNSYTKQMTHIGAVRQAMFSGDGKNILTTSFDGKTRIWDFATGLVVAEAWQPSNLTYSADINPVDGRLAMSGAYNNVLRLVYWQPKILTSYACQRATRNFVDYEWTQYIGDALPYQAVCPNLPIEPEVIITPTP
jgi:WD40 repeat protein